MALFVPDARPVEIWSPHPGRLDEENHREAAFHARNGRPVLLHEHCHTPTCSNPPDVPHRHGDCAGARHWRSDGQAMREVRL